MLHPRFLPYLSKQLFRNGLRTAITIVGVATTMFLFTVIQALQSGLRRATGETALDQTLIVYRANRYCPFTSQLPEYYRARIEAIPGVREVVPMKIVVNNCRASLDVFTYRGVPKDLFAQTHLKQVSIIAGEIEAWFSRSDAVLIGEELAARRRLKPGDRFQAAGITAYVAAIMRSPEIQDQNVAYVDLAFLQRGAGIDKTGIVTQYNVKVSNSDELKAVGEAIDREFKNDAAPTQTRSEKAFVARAAADIVELVDFTAYLAWGCVIAVLALLGNSIVLSVQDRIREHAVLMTLGFGRGLIARLILVEALLLGLCGGLLGSALALGVLRYRGLGISTEGLTVQFVADHRILGMGILLSVLLGLLAGAIPALQASRREIVQAFRAV